MIKNKYDFNKLKTNMIFLRRTDNHFFKYFQKKIIYGSLHVSFSSNFDKKQYLYLYFLLNF